MSDPVVELKSGFVRGVNERHEDGFNYYSFKGIPYAEPPLGELRFQDPIPARRWSGVKDCKSYGPRCLQSDLLMGVRSYNEDCLHLNVFTRSINTLNIKNPVMVVLFGPFGSACDFYFGPEYLMRKDVVIVTITYRLGVLGFLNLEDEIAPGNQGLKDYVIALRWIQQNIRGFGGNPNNVTLWGFSSGGALANFLALSPLVKGLVHKVISHSGVAYSPWVSLCSNSKSNAIKLCSLLGKDLTDSKEIVRFLKTVDTKTLLEAQESLRKSLVYLHTSFEYCSAMTVGLLLSLNISVTFAPGIDNKSANPVMPVHPHILAGQGVHLPYLLGNTTREGIIFMIGASEDVFKNYDRNPDSMYNYNIKNVLTRHNINPLQVKRLYYKGETISKQNSEIYEDFLGDFICVESIHTFAKVQAARSSAATYLYRFDYTTTDSLLKALMQKSFKGAAHLEDLNFLFKMRIRDINNLGPHKKGTQDYRLMEQMTEMWTNFARYGRPTIETSDLIPVHWKPIADGTLLRYLNIDEDMTMQCCVNLDQKYLSAKSIKV